MKKIKPKEDSYAIGGSMGTKKEKSEKHFPTIRIDHEHLPDAKDWKPGEHHHIHAQVKIVSNSQSKFQNEGEYEIHGLDHCDAGCDGENHEHSSAEEEDSKEDKKDLDDDNQEERDRQGSEK